MNDEDRKQWVNNEELLYLDWKNSRELSTSQCKGYQRKSMRGISITKYVRNNREFIDGVIRARLKRKGDN